MRTIYNNYIFDLYGTLVDIQTNERKESVWKKLAAVMSLQGAVYSVRELRQAYRREVLCQEAECLQRARSLSEARVKKVEEPEVEIHLEEVFRRLYENKGVEANAQQIADTGIFFRTLTLETLALFPGAKELLQRLHDRGARVYLLSNAQRMFTEPEMRLLGIYDMFDGILYSSDAGYKKPSGRFYQMLLDTFALNKEESVMVGNDWQADAWGACHAGLDSIYVHTRQSTEITGDLPENCRRIAQISEVLTD